MGLGTGDRRLGTGDRSPTTETFSPHRLSKPGAIIGVAQGAHDMSDTTTPSGPRFAVKFWAAAITILVLMLLSTSLRGGEPSYEIDLGSIDEFVGEMPSEMVIATGHYDPSIREGDESGEPVGRVDETRIWLVARPGEVPVAVLQASPWLGCRIQVANAQQVATFGASVPEDFIGFLDPCHGGIWDHQGFHVAGPGIRGLGRFPTRLTPEGSVIVDLTRLWYLG